jgi:GT2 family glycosyltransferase
VKTKKQERHSPDGKGHRSGIVNGRPAHGAGAPGRIEHLTWLSDGLLLVAGSVAIGGASKLSASVILRGEVVGAEAEGTFYDAAQDRPDGVRGALFVVRCDSGALTGKIPEGLALGAGRAGAKFGPAQLPAKLDDLSTLLRQTVAPLDAEARSRVLQFLVSATRDRLCGSSGLRTSRALFRAREALRERLPLAEIGRDTPLAGHVDAFAAVGPSSFYIRGWLASTAGPLTRVTAVSPEGCRAELLDRLFHRHRPDVNAFFAVSEDGGIPKLGFGCYFEADAPSHLTEGWLIEAANACGDEIEVVVPDPVRDLVTVRNTLLADVSWDPDDRALLVDHVAPAVKQLQRQRGPARIKKVAQYGTPPPDPAVSIIIPLYGRIDFVEQQMAQFVHDAEISQADVVYVLDSPELSQTAFALAPQLAQLYRVPFRLAGLESNVGYSEATNAGASLAHGRLLLLLNSDILPDRPGWLGRMVAFHDATPEIGALGPKLLYEDDSIQHAGLFFYREAQSGLWCNNHYYKGLHRTLPPANVTRAVPGVTGACMMISLELYRQLGGLSGQYVQGDYEDSDLCLRLAEAGRENWYLADVELYHLEGQSYPSQVRRLVAGFNRWLQDHQWSPFIERVMLKYSSNIRVVEPERPARAKHT